jgi:hypothetical protein
MSFPEESYSPTKRPCSSYTKRAVFAERGGVGGLCARGGFEDELAQGVDFVGDGIGGRICCDYADLHYLQSIFVIERKCVVRCTTRFRERIACGIVDEVLRNVPGDVL